MAVRPHVVGRTGVTPPYGLCTWPSQMGCAQSWGRKAVFTTALPLKAGVRPRGSGGSFACPLPSGGAETTANGVRRRRRIDSVGRPGYSRQPFLQGLSESRSPANGPICENGCYGSNINRTRPAIIGSGFSTYQYSAFPVISPPTQESARRNGPDVIGFFVFLSVGALC